MNPRKKFLSVLTLSEFIAGLGLIAIFIILKPIGLKFLFLLAGLILTFLAIYRWLSFTLVPLPEGHCKRCINGLGYVIAGIYFVVNSRSAIWIALVWILIIAGFFGIIMSVQYIYVEVDLLRRLLSAYKKGNLPDLRIPFAYVHFEPGLGEYLSRDLIGRIMKALWEHQSLSPKTEFAAYTDPGRSTKKTSFLRKHHRRAIVFFLGSDSVGRCSNDFRKWLFSYAVAFLVILTPLGENEQYSESFNKEADFGYQRSPGPTFTIWIRPLGRGEHSTFYSVGDHILETSWGLQERSLGGVIAPLSNHLASIALPTAASDSMLSLKNRLMIQEISRNALPPIANSYLRFRLSQSDVERFLSLINCVESIIKLSAIVLLINRWEKLGRGSGDGELMDKKLTLGSWTRLLRDFMKVPTQDKLDREICSFWKSDIFSKQRQLIERVNIAGLYSLNYEGRNQIDWLKWFTDFRNVTRGHGVFDEHAISPFWHLIHEIYLEMVLGLRSLFISSRIVAVEPTGKKDIYRGWLREKLGKFIKQEYSEHETFVFLESESNAMLLLYPLILVKKPNILIFDYMSSKEKSFAFINCVSGERDQIHFSGFSDIRPYSIWESKKQQVDGSFIEEQEVY